MTQEQTESIFEPTRRKLEAELAAAEEESRLRRTAVEEETRLWQELMIKEFDARMAAAATAAAAQAPRRTIVEDDDVIGGVLPEVTNITLRFSGLPQEEIIRIFHNKFKATNLYRLRHMRGL